MGEVARPAPSAAAPVSEDFDAIFEEVSERLQGQMRPPEAPPDVADEASVLLAQLNAEEEQAVVEPEIQAGSSSDSPVVGNSFEMSAREAQSLATASKLAAGHVRTTLRPAPHLREHWGLLLSLARADDPCHAHMHMHRATPTV